MQTLTTLIIYFYCFMSASSTDEGHPCNSSLGWTGTCKLSYECAPLADLVEQGHAPELCNNVGGPIICCPQQTVETTHTKEQPQPEALPLKQFSPILLGKKNKQTNVPLDTIQEPSEYSNPIRKMTTYRKRIVRRRPCVKRYSSHILLKAEDDVDYVKIRTHLNKPIRAKRKPLPIRETIVYPERKVTYDNLGSSPSFETISGSTGLFSYGSHLTQPNIHSIPFAYQSHHPFHISSPTAAAESAIFGKFAGAQDTALSLDDLSEAQSTARPNRSAQKSRPAEMMCSLYSEIVTETVAELSKNGLHSVKSEKCSLVSPTPSQERTVSPGQLPHVVGLGYTDNSEKLQWDECSGALISEKYVLTAAHCTQSPLGQPTVVSLGGTTLGYKSSDIEIEVAEIVIHPQYNSTTYYNNIALLKLAERPNFSDSLRPACLHMDNRIPKGLLVAHWASLPPVTLEVRISKNESHKFADKDGLGLQKTRMSLADNKECDIAPEMDDAFVCAHLISSRSTLNCQGNGGDPLQIRSPSNKCLYNIVGLSVENVCDESVPIAFTKVSQYVTWIESVVWP